MDAGLTEGPHQNKTAPPHGQPGKHLQEASTVLVSFGLLQIDLNL